MRRWAIALSLFLLAGCSRTGAPASSTSAISRDGSVLVGKTAVADGITTIDFPADAFERAPQFVADTVPISVMGGAGAPPDYDLTYARSPILLPGGGYASLVSLGGGRLMIFDSAGKGLRTFGKLGQGPGEFTRPAGPVLLGGDTLLIPDDYNRRFNYFLPDKGLVTIVPMVEPTRTAYTLTTPLGRMAGNHLAWYSSLLHSEDTLHPSRPPIPIGISLMNLDSMRIIDSVPGFEMVPVLTHSPQGARTFAMPPRFAKMSSFALWDTTIAAATGADGYVIDRRNISGHLVQRIRVSTTRRPVTKAMRDAQIEFEISHMPLHGEGGGAISASAIEDAKQRIRENPFADSLPPYGRIVAAPGNVLWVVDAIAPSDTSSNAIAFRSDGAILGRLHLNGKALPVAFGSDRVVVRSVDDDGVVSFKVYRFRLAQ